MVTEYLQTLSICRTAKDLYFRLWQKFYCNESATCVNPVRDLLQSVDNSMYFVSVSIEYIAASKVLASMQQLGDCTVIQCPLLASHNMVL